MDVSAPALATLVRTAYGDLAQAAEKLGDQIDWKPLGKGRSALNQLHECIHLAQIGKGIIETGEFHFDPADRAVIMQQNPTAAETLPTLAQVADEYARTVEAASPEMLAKVISLPFRPGMTKTVAETALMLYWNAVYHEGQINYIETLTDNFTPRA